jgi:hypothetical protein
VAGKSFSAHPIRSRKRNVFSAKNDSPGHEISVSADPRTCLLHVARIRGYLYFILMCICVLHPHTAFAARALFTNRYFDGNV